MSVKPVAWTPGPWLTSNCVVYAMQDGQQFHIANVHRIYDVPLVGIAPELAEALQRITTTIEAIRDDRVSLDMDLGRTPAEKLERQHYLMNQVMLNADKLDGLLNESAKLLARITPK